MCHLADDFMWDSFASLPVDSVRSPIDLDQAASHSASKERKVRVSLPPKALDKLKNSRTEVIPSSSDELARPTLQKQTETLQIERLQLEL